jgi:hypothetical protein
MSEQGGYRDAVHCPQPAQFEADAPFRTTMANCARPFPERRRRARLAVCTASGRGWRRHGRRQGARSPRRLPSAVSISTNCRRRATNAISSRLCASGANCRACGLISSANRASALAPIAWFWQATRGTRKVPDLAGIDHRCGPPQGQKLLPGVKSKA